MNKIKIIDLLNMISRGEEVPKKIRIDHWCYKFEWIEHLSNYYDRDAEIDLMSCLSCDKEELNYGVHEIKEEKKIPEKLEENKIPDKLKYYDINDFKDSLSGLREYTTISFVDVFDKINEICDYLKSKGE